MTADKFDLTGKVAIIIGATKGMGEVIAHQFAGSGARVMVNSRTAADAAAVAETLNTTYGNGDRIAISKAGDMTVKADLQAVVDTTVETWGSVTTLVLSPTIRPWFGPSIDIPDDEIDTQFLFTFKCRFWVTAMCLPHMVRAGGGSIVYIGSGSAFEATSERSIYSCARAAEVQMMKNFAAEYGEHNVRLNIISPGLIDAHGSKALFSDPEAVRRITSNLPMRRHGTMAEISNVATFLASDASSFTTGAVIPVDGGRLLRAVSNNLTSSFASEQATRMGAKS